jgi:hypothetical protein
VIYTSFSSHCDHRPFTGWIMAYSARPLEQVAVLNVTANGNDGAFWAAGGGPASDAAGNLYFMVANGTFDRSLNVQGFPALGNFGNSLLKLSLNGNHLAVADYFAPYTAAVGATEENIEPGSGGMLVLPDMTDANGSVRHLAIGAGKDANIYVVDRDHMGKYNPANNNSVYQDITGALGGPGGDGNQDAGAVRMTPAYFNGTVYFAANLAPIEAFSFNQALLSKTPVTATSYTFPYPGASLSISANGTINGIVWALEAATGGVLHAYTAGDLTNELYNSNQAPGGRDQFGPFLKFVPPTVANGRVYVATPSGVTAFGLLAAASRN